MLSINSDGPRRSISSARLSASQPNNNSSNTSSRQEHTTPLLSLDTTDPRGLSKPSKFVTDIILQMDRQYKLLSALVAVVFLLFLVSKGGSSSETRYGGHLRGNFLDEEKNEEGVWGRSTKANGVLEFAVVADLDSTSRIVSKEGGCDKDEWKSIMKIGKLFKNSLGIYDVKFFSEEILTSKLAEGGRGLELSELMRWQDKLLTFDDRTGTVFEVTPEFQVIPRYILTEGDGSVAKGQKTEWATVKDGLLYVGSFGKEYIRNGQVSSRNNMWINIVYPNGDIEHVDWTDKYQVLREATDSVFPGYMVHEAIHFDPIHRQWFVLPRRISSDPYDEKEDELKGSNVLLVLDEDFTKVVRKITVGPQVPLRGWSSFKFVPFTNQQHIVALKTEEQEDKVNPKDTIQNTYITVFDIDGNELLPQTKFDNVKFEGIAFL